MNFIEGHDDDEEAINDIEDKSLLNINRVIMQTSVDTHDGSVIDAISEYCNNTGIDAQELVPYMNKSLIDKIKAEAIERKLVDVSNTSLSGFFE